MKRREGRTVTQGSSENEDSCDSVSPQHGVASNYRIQELIDPEH
jgi:hypothetical protein